MFFFILSIKNGIWEFFIKTKEETIMITLYGGKNNISNKKAEKWFQKAGVKVSIKKIDQISQKDLFQILLLSEKGFLDILKKEKATFCYGKLLQEFQNLTFNEAIDFLSKHSELLRTPIIFDSTKLVIGFNEDEIRTFLSQNYRKLKLKNIIQK